jgi:hypothetical protein
MNCEGFGRKFSWCYRRFTSAFGGEDLGKQHITAARINGVPVPPEYKAGTSGSATPVCLAFPLVCRIEFLLREPEPK